MRAAVSRVLTILFILCAVTAFAQQPQRRVPGAAEPDKSQDVAPATAPTTEEAADKVKKPMGPEAMPTAAPVDPKTFVLGAEDIILVRVWREADLSFAAQIRPDGKITMQLIGDLEAAGKTPEQLRDVIVEKLSEYLNKPEVTVSVQS